MEVTCIYFKIGKLASHLAIYKALPALMEGFLHGGHHVPLYLEHIHFSPRADLPASSRVCHGLSHVHLSGLALALLTISWVLPCRCAHCPGSHPSGLKSSGAFIPGLGSVSTCRSNLKATAPC